MAHTFLRSGDDMTTRYFIDSNGAYKGGYDGETGVDTSEWIEVTARDHPGQIWIDGAWQFTKASLCGFLAEYRYNKEIGGIVLEGLPVPTDDRAKNLIAGKYSKVIAENDPDAAFTIKAAGQFMEITNAQLIGIFHAVNAHVQKCFDAEAVVYAAIMSDDITSKDEVYAAFETAFAA